LLVAASPENTENIEEVEGRLKRVGAKTVGKRARRKKKERGPFLSLR